MTTVEKLFAQIFERKKSIIEQVKQQTELYRQYLASKSLIDGITPPSWLWNPNTSNLEELNKDELISKILCPYPQSSTHWSFAHYPGYNNLVITGDNEEFCDRVSPENPAFCKGLNRQNDPTVPALSTDDHVECILNCVPELDSSVTSPEDHTDERILNIYHAPDQSLAAITRSKSRQKALKLRSAKALVKSGLGNENAEDVDSSQIKFSLSPTVQEGQNNVLSQSTAEPRAIGAQSCEEMNLEKAVCTSREKGEKALEFQVSAEATRSGLRYENTSDVVFIQIRDSLSATDQAGQNDELPQSMEEPRAVGRQSCEEINLDEADCTSREQRRENAKDVSSQIRFSISATDQAGQADELPESAVGGQSFDEMNLDEADCTSREKGEKALELQVSADAAKSGLRYENTSDVVSSQIRDSPSATDQAGQDDELPQSMKEPRALGGQSCEEMYLDESDCTSREQRCENATDVDSSQIRFSFSPTDQKGQNDELPESVAEPCAVGGQNCDEMNLDEADCTSRDKGEKALELQVSTEAAKSGLRYETTSDVVFSQIRDSLSATDQARQNDELPCTSREKGEKALELHVITEAAKSGLRYENTSDVVFSQIRDSLSATDQARQNDELPQSVEEPRSVGGQSCVEMNLDETDCSSREQRCEDAKDVSGQIKFSISATDQAGQTDELTELVAEPCAVDGQSCDEMNLDEAYCTSREMGMGTFSGIVTRSRSCTVGPLTLDCSSKDCKENDICHVAKARRTESLPTSHSEHADICINFSKSVGPSDMYRQSSGGRRVDDASFAIKDKETNVFTGKITRPSISMKRQSCSGSSKDDNSCDNNHGIDIATTLSENNLAPETGDGSLVKVNLPNVCNEDGVTRTSISEDYRRYKERNTLPSSSSSQHNTRVDAVSDLEASAFSAKVDGGILASSSGASARQVIDSPKDDNSCDNYQGIDIAATESGNNLTPKTGDGSLVNVNLPNVCSEGHDTRTSISEDSRRYKVKDTLQSSSSRQHNSHVNAVADLEASSFYAKVDGCILASSSGVSARQVIDSIEALGLVKPSVGLFRRLTRSQTRCNDKETYQPVASSKNPSFRSPISETDTRACLDVEVCSQHGDSSLKDNVLGTHTTARLHGENSSHQGNLRHTSIESWPQVKRRKIERQQANSFTTSPSFRAKKHNSHRDPVSTYLNSMGINADTAFIERINESTDIRIFPEMNSSLKERHLFQHGEVGSCYKDKTETKASPSDVNNQLEPSLVSRLPLMEPTNSKECFVDGVKTSLSSSTPFDARMSGNEECSKHLCNLEKSADNLYSKKFKLSNTSLEEIQSPKWENGSHTQHSVLSPSNEDLQQADVDQSIPVFEGFIVDSQTNSGDLNFVADGFHFDELNLPRTTLERVSILAEMCRSASLDRLSYQFSSDFEFEGTQNIFQSVPNGGNLEDTFPLSSDVGKRLQSGSSSSDDYKDTVDGMPYSVSRAYSGAHYGWISRNQYPSPVGKLWDRPSSYTGSSEKRLSSNPELTCFPIEEDPSISEEYKTVDENTGDMPEINSSLPNCDENKPFKDLTNLNLSVSVEEDVSTKFSVTGTQEKAHCGPRGSKYQYRNKSGVSENQTSSTGAVDFRTNKPSCIGAKQTKAKKSTNNSISKLIVVNKTSLKGHVQKLSMKGSMKNNIVSNVSSFIPLVQQKQAATACAGKRDVKVKALEAAEAAKRLEEKKENERKLKKEAMKLEREEKNLRQMEFEKKKKEEERKKKDADIMAKKRQREEEEKKEKEKKRMRTDATQRQREKDGKKNAEKAEKQREKRRSKDQPVNNSKESHDEPKTQQSETIREDGVALQKEETKLPLTGVGMNHGEYGTVISGEVEKAMHSVDLSPRKEDLIAQNNQAKQYEISPYQCSDDDDEEDDELPTKKFIPSWASKNSVAMFLPLQQKLDPDVIFPIESFCNMDEVLLPRKLQQSQVAT